VKDHPTQSSRTDGAKTKSLYQDLCDGPTPAASKKKGYAKVQGACDAAASFQNQYYNNSCSRGCFYFRYNHVWIDTCCIDKSSSAELSEAINSMFRWYAEAQICFAFLDDVTANGNRPFGKSLWFTRGWTLQELIAPQKVVFYDADWKELGDRFSMSKGLSAITGIPVHLLSRKPTSSYEDAEDARHWPATCSVAAKMSWASKG